MSLEDDITSAISDLPPTYLYRVTYDQGASQGKWRIVALDRHDKRPICGGAGRQLDKAVDIVKRAIVAEENWTVQTTPDE